MPTITQVLRRVYSDMIKGRTRVTLHPSAEPAMDEDPIFVIGLFRSGTTLMRYLLDSHSRVACPPETRFMQHLAQVVESERSLNGMRAMGFDRAHTIQQLRKSICYFMENYANSKSKPRWADKTPEYVDILSFLKEVFPTGRFVMLYRHPLDQIRSNVKSGLGISDRITEFIEPGDSEFESGAKYWSAQTSKMMEFEKANPENTHRIRYEDLCENPEKFLKPMFEFLGESWEPAVLEYHKFDHDYGAEDGKVGTSRAITRSQTDYSKWNEGDLNASFKITKDVAAMLDYEFPKLSLAQ